MSRDLARARYQVLAEAHADLEQSRAEALAADPDEEPANDLRADLFDLQREFLCELAANDLVCLLCGRRAGKTHVVPVAMVEAALARPDAHVIYVTLTQSNAEELIWERLQECAEASGVPHRVWEGKLRIRFTNGSRIRLLGADNKREIRKLRGHGYDLVVFDECGEIEPAILRALMKKIVGPALADHDGKLVLAGTPGEVLEGPWYDMTRNEAAQRKGGAVVLNWTAEQNTAAPLAWPRLLKDKAKDDVPDDDPDWIREGLGQWCSNPSVLVYPLSKRNDVRGLPTHTLGGVPMSPYGWRWVLGVDVGFVDACAFVLVACHEKDPCDYVVSSEKFTGMLPDACGDRIGEYLEERPYIQVVEDSGGMGKAYTEWHGLRSKLPIRAAEKRDKKAAIRDTRGRVMSGSLRVLEGPQNTDLRSEMAKLGWKDERKEDHKPGQEDHCCDALLYALRALRNFNEAPPLGPAMSPADLEEERLIAEREAALRGNGREWWDR